MSCPRRRLCRVAPAVKSRVYGAPHSSTSLLRGRTACFVTRSHGGRGRRGHGHRLADAGAAGVPLEARWRPGEGLQVEQALVRARSSPARGGRGGSQCAIPRRAR
eukprot:3722419-Prymnesium_polylepis.1